jgi:hypothetical protein
LSVRDTFLAWSGANPLQPHPGFPAPFTKGSAETTGKPENHDAFERVDTAVEDYGRLEHGPAQSSTP